jgi:kynureninase
MRTPLDPAARGGAVMIAVPRPEETARRLRERRVLVDWRPGVGLRFGPHFFNTDDEIAEAFDHLDAILG